MYSISSHCTNSSNSNKKGIEDGKIICSGYLGRKLVEMEHLEKENTDLLNLDEIN